MNYSVGKPGRVIVARLEDGDDIYKSIQGLCDSEDVKNGTVWFVGGIKNGGIVCGPEGDGSFPLTPHIEKFIDPREIVGFGTLFRNEQNKTVMHMHGGFGRGKSSIVGCARKGADCWLITEAVIMEIDGVNAKRILDRESGFELLEIED